MAKDVLGNARFVGNSKRAVAAYWLASGSTQEIAAEHAKVHVATLRRWLRNDDPDLLRELEQVRRQVRRGAYYEALQVVRNKLKSSDDNVALRAAHEIIASVDHDYPTKHELTGEGGGAIVIVYDEERDEETDMGDVTP